ncbi:MAG: hypothetical protein IJU72_00085 [Bacteroidales bacterium]|nr:hypothetical protein [Bacteroidales bacterium]
MKQLHIIIISLATALAFSGCAYSPQNYYMYQPHNVPMLRGSDEVAIDVSAAYNYEWETGAPIPIPGTQKHETYGFNISTAYSPIRHLGLMGGYNLYHWEGTTAHNGEIAVGFYLPFAKYMVFDMYIGDNMNFLQHHLGAEQVSLRMNKIFLQPSLGFSYAPIDLVYAARVGYANYYGLKHDLSIPGEINAVNYLIGSPHLMLERSLTFRAGYKDIKGQVQIAHAVKLGSTPADMPRLNSFTVSLGLHFTFGRKFP